ncbi:MAG: AraC family transcriptional regulator ligand-binding domain-containing protein [Gemmatimonadaceae bacterium]
MTKSVPTIAATSTLAMLRTAVARGAVVSDLLDQAGLSWESLEYPDARIPAPTVLGLWNALRQRTGDDTLQLTAPAILPFGAYRIIDYLVAASTTVGDGIQRFAHFFSLIAESLELDVSRTAGRYQVTLTTTDGGAVPPVYVDYVFAALVSRIQLRICPALQVQRLDLRQPEPRHPDIYRRVFGAPVHFASPHDRLSIDVDVWGAPTVNGDAALVALLEDHARILASRPARPATGFTEDVKRAITATLAGGSSAELVARTLNVSVRTLQRKLIASGTTFRELSESVRGQLAEGYLSDKRVSVSEVAVLLGFSEQSAFNRAFRRWTGESPGRWRRRAL